MKNSQMVLSSANVRQSRETSNNNSSGKYETKII
jgi:hypothetical protein